MITPAFTKQETDHKILVSIPTLQKTGQNQDAEVSTSSETREVYDSKFPSWYSGIYLLLGRIEEICSQFQEQMSGWEQRAFSLQEKLVSHEEVEKAAEILLNFLDQELEKEENKHLKFTNGAVTIHFSGDVAINKALIRQAKLKTDKPLLQSTYERMMQTTRRFYFSQFNLKKTSWTPHEDPIKLKEILSEHGPLLVFGRFGQKFYEDEQFQLTDEKFLSHEFFGWRKGAKRVSESQAKTIEAVIVVGAWIDKGISRVYFVDPYALGGRKINVISYANLIANITNENLMLFSNIEADQDFDYTPSFNKDTFGKIGLYNLLENPGKRHPGIDYHKQCKSNYGYHNKDWTHIKTDAEKL